MNFLLNKKLNSKLYCFQVPRLYCTLKNKNDFLEKIAAKIQKVIENCLDGILFTDFPFCVITSLRELC